MPNRMQGRNALVTGASRGIGAAVAERLAAEGANVVITARTVDRHATLAGSLHETLERARRHGTTVELVAADLADGDDRARIVPEATALLGGPIDVLVNNAAAGVYQPLVDYPLRRRRLMFEVNVHAPVDLVQAVVPGMRRRGEGWVVNLSSGSARLASGPPFRTTGMALVNSVYGATKAALNRLTNALAVELYGTGIRVNTVEPHAAVATEGAVAHLGDTIADHPVEAMETMVEAVLYLCDCGPEHTGRIEVSRDLLDATGTTVMALDGTRPA